MGQNGEKPRSNRKGGDPRNRLATQPRREHSGRAPFRCARNGEGAALCGVRPSVRGCEALAAAPGRASPASCAAWSLPPSCTRVSSSILSASRPSCISIALNSTRASSRRYSEAASWAPGTGGADFADRSISSVKAPERNSVSIALATERVMRWPCSSLMAAGLGFLDPADKAGGHHRDLDLVAEILFRRIFDPVPDGDQEGGRSRP